MDLPSYQMLANTYPLGSLNTVKALVGGNVNLPWVTNSCAIRVSRAFNYSGHPIPQGFPGMDTAKGGDGMRYAYRIVELTMWIEYTFGAPNVTGKTSADFAGKKGLIIFDFGGPDSDECYGHMDIWDGSGCINCCWFAESKVVKLWIAK
jgi:hypothetical protein